METQVQQTETQTETISGPVHVWELGNERRYSVVTLPFRQANKVFQASLYNALANKGEQRQTVLAHVAKLRREMEEGKFTPTPIAVGLRKKHLSEMQVSGSQFTLAVHTDNPLPLIDGDHRFNGIESILESLEESLKKLEGKTDAGSLEDAEAVRAKIKMIGSLPITTMVHLDGDPQRDFLNLQAGKPVDKSHLFSLRVLKGSDPHLRAAFETAKVLHKLEGSPFYGQIRFDTRGKQPLPISTLCAKGTSDQGTSLVGLAKIGEGTPSVPPAELANYVIKAFQTIKAGAPELLEFGKPLTPISESGTKGSATMLIGIGLCLCYCSDIGDDILISATRSAFDRLIHKNFSGSMKRELLGEFARAYFAGEDCPKHGGVPAELVEKLSAGAFGLAPLAPRGKNESI